jgi:hypothetical protein
MNNFKRAIDFVLRWEGGYIFDSEDPGGETKYGISKRYHPKIDIKALTEAQAREIYRREYWLKAGCETMNWPDCLVQLDTAVNLGVSRASLFHNLAGDWTDYLFLRIEYYCTKVRDKPFKIKYLRGWINRVIDLYKTASIKDPAHPVSTNYKG